MTEEVPAGRADRPTSAPPVTPDGYDEPYLLEYSTVVLLFLSVPMFLLSSIGFGWVFRALQDRAVSAAVFDVTETEAGTTIALDLTAVGVPFLAALLVTVVVHELIHGAAMRYYGQTVTYGFHPAMGAFYASAFGQFQEREQLLRVAIAPLACITAIAAPLLAVPVPLFALTVYFVLILNATGAVGDLYVGWRLLRMPEGTRTYDADLRHWYVFEPLESGETSE